MMKRRTIAMFILAAGVCITSGAQLPAPDSLFQEVLSNNRTLRVARESYQVALLESGVGNTPPDPEVEFGYLYGKPAELGNRVDFSVKQRVDFPSAYIHKSHLRKIRNSQAELAYALSRQEILLQAKQLWIERIYLNLEEQLLVKRLRQAGTIDGHFRQKLASGEVDRLTYNQSVLQLAALESEYEAVLSEIRSNRLAMKEITGGKEVEITDTVFPAPAVIIPDTLWQDYLQGPGLQLHHQAMQLKEQQKSLTVSQHLPKLSAGYYSESVMDQQFRGFQVGITVPLWENANRIKMANSEVAFAQADAERYTSLRKKEILQALDQLESLKLRTRKLEEALDAGNSTGMLVLALKQGEISLTEYFYTTEFYFRNELLLLQYKRDQLLKEAELLKVYL